MRPEKLRELDDNELHSQHREIREQLFRLRFQLGMGQADGLKKYRVLKKDRARIQTILREREMNSSGEAASTEEGSD
ncbi:MAG: 50S ribosomal protein L29 [bacterium]|nr:50S ribosomal protein L29 [bacterium]